MAQQAQYDPSAGQQEAAAAQPLSGNVSTFYASPPSSYDQYSMQNSPQSSMPAMPAVPRRIKTAKKPAGTRAPRMTPGQMPVVPEQLVQAPQIQPLIPEPPVQRNVRPQFPTSMPVAGFSQMPMQQMQQMQMMQQQQMSQQQMQMQPMQQMQMQPMQMQQMQQQQSFQRPMQMPMQLQPPKLTVQQQASLDRMVEQNPPPYHMNVNGELIGAASDNPDNGAGQPPFPLNLMPMNALMQGRHKSNVAQARFGSWHGGSGLPSAGFHTWLPVRTPTHFEYSRAPMPSTKRKVTKKPAAPVHQAVAHSTPPQVVRPMLASYPVYTSMRGAAY